MNDLPKEDKMQEGLREFQANLVTMMAFHKLNARLIREKFKALVDEGFTEEQALKLCMEIKI